MKALLIYLLVTSVCTGVFYGCFRLLMRKETCFAFNRATLLLIVILRVELDRRDDSGNDVRDSFERVFYGVSAAGR